MNAKGIGSEGGMSAHGPAACGSSKMRVEPLALLFLAACGSSPASTAGPTAHAEPGPGDAPRIVAVGDLHGDLAQAEAALQLAGVLGPDGAWAGGDTILVQTGDVFDRGPDSRAILDLLRSLQRDAPAAGGAVHALLGNHEVMNLTGDLRYVHPGEIEAFGGPGPREAALSRDGDYGAWLRGRSAVARVGDTVFVHGGVTPAFARLGIDRINARVRDAIDLPPTERARAEVLGPDGPLWFRGYLSAPEAEACPLLDEALRALDAERMVVGHTTQRSGRIAVRCDGRLFGIDTGIASGYGGNLAVLALSGDEASAIYPDGRVALAAASPAEPAQP